MARRNDHHNRVNRVLDYIAQHLDEELSLSKLSAVGCFSAFHFHRIFVSVTGETLNQHVRRVRLERAALLMKASPRKRITDVAIEVGFAGAAEFSRAFRSHFGRTASSWDRRSPLEKSKICKAPESRPFYSVEELEQWKAATGVQVRVNRLETFRYVYLRIFEPYGNHRLVDAYRAITAWLASRGTDFRDVSVIGMSQDDPAVTPSEKCRYDLGVAFPQSLGDGLLAEIVRSRGRAQRALPAPGPAECARNGFSHRDLAPREIAGIHCSGDLGHVDRAWHYLYRVWLPEAAFDPADLPAMEIFVSLPEEIGWERFDLQACIPVARR